MRPLPKSEKARQFRLISTVYEVIHDAAILEVLCFTSNRSQEAGSGGHNMALDKDARKRRPRTCQPGRSAKKHRLIPKMLLKKESDHDRLV